MGLKKVILELRIKQIENSIRKYKAYFKKTRATNSYARNSILLTWIKKDKELLAYKKEQLKLERKRLRL